MLIGTDIEENILQISRDSNFGVNFDVLRRIFMIGDKKCALFMIDGCTDQTEISLVMSSVIERGGEGPRNIAEALALIPFGEVVPYIDYEDVLNALLSGSPILFIDGISAAFMIDAKDFPQRETTEPEKERSLRGSHDGFIEVPVKNASLIRRRLHTSDLIMERLNTGTSAESFAVLCYMKSRANLAYVAKLREQILECGAQALVMNQESLTEYIVRKSPFNPYPKTRQSERPDMVAAALLEGQTAIIIDNASTVLIMPARFVDFMREANDYYFPIFTGTYFRILRMAMILFSLFFSPFFLLLNQFADKVPKMFEIFINDEPMKIPLFTQLIVYEFIIGALRLSNLNIPKNLGSALSIISGVIVGEYAVQSGWACSQVVFYMSSIAVMAYAQQNLELGYAIKFTRIGILCLTWLFGVYGYVGGVILWFVLLSLMKTADGKPYFSPIIPFKPKEFFRDIRRKKIKL